ncbi:unnamed protein product, partial [Iphiclides podalirius]
MAKGKKKGQKKDEPTTSSGGLGYESTSQEPTTSGVSPPETSKAAEPQQVKEFVDEEGDGLSLDFGSRKKKPRKKKGPAAPVEAASSQPPPPQAQSQPQRQAEPLSPDSLDLSKMSVGSGRGQRDRTWNQPPAPGQLAGYGRGRQTQGVPQQGPVSQPPVSALPGLGQQGHASQFAGYGRERQTQDIRAGSSTWARDGASHETVPQQGPVSQPPVFIPPGLGQPDHASQFAGYGMGRQTQDVRAGGSTWARDGASRDTVPQQGPVSQPPVFTPPGLGQPDHASQFAGYRMGRQTQDVRAGGSTWARDGASRETVPQQGPVSQPPVSAPASFGQPGHASQLTGYGRGRQTQEVRAGGYGRGRGSSAQPPPAEPRRPPDSQAPKALSAIQYRIPEAIRRISVPARTIQVLTNYLPMSIKFMKIHRYDVSIKPDRPKKMIPQAFNLAKAQKFANYTIAFDQMKNCYCIQQLPGVNQSDRYAVDVEITDNNGKILKFEVSFKYTGAVDLSRIQQFMATGGSSLAPPTDAIQCIDVILRQGTLESYVKAGRQFFKRPAQTIDLGDGLEMWTGLFQSAIFTSMSFINIDVAHKGFPKKQSMIDALVNDFRLDPHRSFEQQRQQMWAIEKFNEFIKGLRVLAVIGADTSTKGHKREFICNGVVDPPHKLKFPMTGPDGRQTTMTVADYFKKEKNYTLKFPNLNCMWVGPRNKNIYFPMELLEVVYGQALRKQLNETQLSKMVREAATPPNIRKKKIEDVIKDMNYSRNPFFKHFGLEISEKFLQVEAKVLQPPKILVGGGRSIEPRRGVWQSNTVLQPEALNSWGFIAIESDPRQCNFNGMIEMIMRVGNQMGMRVSPPSCTHFNTRINELMNVLFTALERDIKFLFIIVSRRGRDYYHRVKRFAELEVGILTQCVKEETAARRMNDQTVRNILLKVNSKLMGINQALDGRSMPSCLKGPVMVVGADVTHPSPDQTSIPSIAAVTASIDQKCFLYNIELCVQTPKKEIIVEFEDMMVEHLQVYRKHQHTLPKKIYVFRDGVSEGQFEEVMNSELTAVYRAYQRMTGTSEKPEVLFLLVQKRHHTRFFSGADNPQNVEPGTVVDKQIVHARELDFYLVSHQAIKGTARPTRYHAVCNDGGIPLDEVEQLTYYLCHLYSRCMRAVSYPTPTYYAHLACLRAKSLTYGDTFNNQELEIRPKRLHVLKKMLDFSRMFFV